MIRIAIAALLVASSAFAQTPTPADAAFKRGRELLKAGKFADACVEFEHSQKLDPALGTAFNIAQCSEKIGKYARALELYREMAAKDTNADRKKVVTAQIPVLEGKVPHLTVKVATPPPGLAITLEVINSGLPPRVLEPNKEIEIDFGEYALHGKATGAPDWNQNFRVDTEGKAYTYDAPFGVKVEPVKPTTTTTTTTTTTPPKTTATTTGTESIQKPDEPQDTPEPPKSKRKLYGVIALSAGGAALVTGVVFGAMAKGKWSDAKDVCGGTTCTTQMDLDKANRLKNAAQSKATLSTVFVAAGVVGAAVGVVLFVTAPSSESSTRVTAHPTQDGAGITLSGRF